MSKFRTMVVDATRLSPVVTTPSNDPRITRVGHWLRRCHVDELPQLFDVLRGEMSVVGPRPEVPQYVDLLNAEQREILSIRPGITDLASIWIGDKGELVEGALDPERVYTDEIRPVKIRLQLEYVRTRSMRKDVVIVCRTFIDHLIGPVSRAVLRAVSAQIGKLGTVRGSSRTP